MTIEVWLRKALPALLLAGLAAVSGFAQVGGPPVITVQPLSQTVLIGDTAVFSVVAVSGTTMSYQWRRNGTNIAGATQSAFALSSVRSSDATEYSVRIANAGGSVVSSNATLTVLAQAISTVGATGDSTCISGTNVAGRTWSHTVSPGNNRILLVGIALAETADTVSSVTYGGSALTRLAATQSGNTVEMWYLLAPRVGTANIAATFTGSKDMAGWSGSYTNVDQTSPIRSAAATNGNSLSPSITLPAVVGDLVVDTLSANGDAVTLAPSVGQAQICQNTTGNGGSDCWGASSYKSGAASVTMSWLTGAAKNWGIAAAALRAAPALQADVATTVTGPSGVLAGANFTYTIFVTNAGSATASNLVVADFIPTDVTFFSASAGGALSNGVVIWPAFHLAANTSTTLTLTVTAPGSGVLTNWVTGTANTYDPDASNNNGSAANAQVVTAITPQGSPGLAGAADTACTTATNVATRTWLHTVSGGSNRILVVGITLADTGDSVTAVTYSSVALNRITSIQSGNTAELWYLLAPPTGTANLVATWTGNRDMVGWSGTFTNVDQANPIRISAVNNGNSGTPGLAITAAAGDLVVDTLSANGDADLVTADLGQVQICQNRTGNAGGDCWGASSYRPGASEVIMSWVTGAAKNWGIAAAVLRAAPPLQADLTASLTGLVSVAAGDNFTQTVSISNLGPQSATGIIVRDTLPAGISVVAVTGAATVSNGVVAWMIPNLASMATTNLTLTMKANTIGQFTNTVIASSGASDPVAGNNTSSFILMATNIPPVAHSQSISTPESAERAMTLTGADGNNDPLTFAIINPPVHGVIGAFDPNNGMLIYTPTAGYIGSDSFTFRVNDSLANSSLAMVSILVTANLPNIVTQPASQSVMAGQSAALSVVANGSGPLSYQWNRDGAPLAGATNSTLTFNPVQTSDAGSYAVTITNSAGSTTSAAAMLTVTNMPITLSVSGSVGMKQDGFSFQLSVPAGATYVVFASSNARDWTPIATNIAMASGVVFTDSAAANHNARFYRVMVQ